MGVFAVLQFPGSNDDRDMLFAMKSALGVDARLVWHQEAELPAGTEAVLLPGGFSYGDYLRCGAMARFSPVLEAVRRFARSGGPVLGTCNGFQVLCEAGLLPGALLRNRGLDFLCEWTHVRVDRVAAPFTSRARTGQVLRIPIKHGEGRYTASPETLAELERTGRVALRYCEPDGAISERANPNGSVANVAGVLNAEGNVLGLMPHPEHAVEALTGGTDGLVILGSLVDAVQAAGAAARARAAGGGEER